MDKKLILNELINHYANGNNTKFANLLGVSQQVVANWKKRGVLDYELILEKLPEVSAEWLMRGIGSMLKDGTTAPEQHDEQHDEPQSIAERQLDVLETIAQDLTEIKIHIYRLREEQKERETGKKDGSMCG